MKLLKQGIYTKFVGSALAGAVTNRLYYARAPQGSSFPYIIYNIVSTSDDWDFTSSFMEFEVQFSIFSSTDLSVETVATALRTLYDHCTLTVTGWTFLYMQPNFAAENNSVGDDPPTFGRTISYEVLIEKART
jgi:hypothetical protein